jgi:aldehyde dehydrogenase (NAD+)
MQSNRPVQTITPFDTEDEAIALANATRYGLTNYVHSGDVERARRVARRLRSGMVEINGRFCCFYRLYDQNFFRVFEC